MSSHKSSIKEIHDFCMHMYDLGNKLSDYYHDGIAYNENDYNIKISCYGKEIQIDLNADFVSSLDGILEEEIKYMEGLNEKI